MILRVHELEPSPSVGVTAWAFYGVHPLTWGVLNLGACISFSVNVFSLRLCTCHVLSMRLSLLCLQSYTLHCCQATSGVVMLRPGNLQTLLILTER